LVAKVEPLPHELNEEQLAILKAENDIEKAGAAALDTFYVDPIEGAFDRPRRINFCTITPFSISAVETFLNLKRAELGPRDPRPAAHQAGLLLRAARMI
jgi:hypothetical protein